MNTYVVKSQDIMLSNNMWKNYIYQNGYGDEQQVKLLLLVIPFEDTGAMETFLLNAIANNDEYDAKIISKCNSFVDCVDEQKDILISVDTLQRLNLMSTFQLGHRLNNLMKDEISLKVYLGRITHLYKAA